MKQMYLLAISGMLVMGLWSAGCKAPASKPLKPTAIPALKPTAATAEDLQFTDEIYATVTADQMFEMDGKLYNVKDIPTVLKDKKANEYVTIVVMPESKMTRETLSNLLQILVDNDFLVALGEESKFADTIVPKKQS